MEELIKEAESLYEAIRKNQTELDKARLDGNEQEEKYTLNHMETNMCATIYFLERIIKRKKNIVDLSELWKDGSKEKPVPYAPIVIKDCYITSGHDDDVDESQWAYLEDLLPKGGES